MSVSIGVVCEGSHDYNMLNVFIRQIGADAGINIGDIDCLQPKVSASFQTTSGGWGRVKGWCEQGDGKAYRVHLDKPLFGTSKTYDLLLIHLDGDVVSLCSAEPLAALKTENLSPADAVAAIRTAIKGHWLKPEKAHIPRIIVCAPVWHMEAWLLAALDPAAQDVERRSTKSEFREGLYKKFAGKAKDRYLNAALASASQCEKIRGLCDSFSMFSDDVVRAANAA